MSVSDSSLPIDESLTVASVVHDVNQMLTVISGRAGLLLAQGVDSQWEPHLRAMLLASGDAASMLRRLSSSGARVAPEAGAELRVVAEEAKLLVWPVAANDYAWHNEVAPGLITTVPAQVLREVLANLLLNALAVMPGGGRMRLNGGDERDGRVQLTLTDSGPGLSRDDLTRIFEPGVSGSGETGRGIGLAGCRQLLAGVGGRLTAEQGVPESGAVLVLDLPAGELVGADPVSEPVVVPTMGILVVDDEAGVRDMLGDVLSAWGCRVQSCRDSETALNTYTPGTAAVALIDRNLPGLGGLELATRLRVSDPYLSIVLMTGWQQREDLLPVDPAVVDQEAEKPLAIDRIQEILGVGYELNQERRSRDTKS